MLRLLFGCRYQISGDGLGCLQVCNPVEGVWGWGRSETEGVWEWGGGGGGGCVGVGWKWRICWGKVEVRRRVCGMGWR